MSKEKVGKGCGCVGGGGWKWNEEQATKYKSLTTQTDCYM
jgi:hypothetical protein